MSLKEFRIKCQLTQVQAAELFGISIRSYKTYENDPAKKGTMKYNYMLQQLSQLCRIDETHGILSVEDIKRSCERVLQDYPITYCYLFGSYAKGEANESSDVDLLVSSEVHGLKYYGMVEKLKTELRKNVDVLASDQLLNNMELLNNVLREGIRIYEKQ